MIDTFREQHHESMVDSTETVTLTWENVDAYVEPPTRGCCRGPDPNVPRKQVLKQGKFFLYHVTGERQTCTCRQLIKLCQICPCLWNAKSDIFIQRKR